MIQGTSTAKWKSRLLTPAALEFALPLFLLLTLQFACELVFIPMAGIQEDEMLFATPFLNGHPAQYAWGPIPVMLLDYIGALKTWIYWPLFRIAPPAVWSVRLPVCILSLVTVGLFADFTRRVSGPRTALFAAALLATDASFILTNVYDWGPVCLLLLSTIAFLWLTQRFLEAGNRVCLAAAFLLAGLATWYKPLIAVVIAAIVLAWMIVNGRKLKTLLKPRILLIAIAGFLFGTVPLIAFNAQNQLATFKAGRYLPQVPLSEKLLMMLRTLDGRALEHYMFRSAPGETIRLTGAPIGELVEGWYRQSSLHPGGLLLPALILSLLALPFLSASRQFSALCVSWLAATLAFGVMLMYHDAGAGPHHTLLLYPAPQFIVAATAVALADRLKARSVASLIVLAIAVSNLWLLGQYAQAGRRNGFSVYWTDGVDALTKEIESRHLPAAFLDWGIENGVQTMSGQRVPVALPFPLRSGVLYVTHCDGYVIDPARTEEYRKFLLDERVSATNQRVVTDRHGAPIFCTFEVAK